MRIYTQRKGMQTATHTRAYQGEWFPVLPSCLLLARKHPFLYKSSWQSRTAHVHWPRDHTSGIAYKNAPSPNTPLYWRIHKTVHGVEDAKTFLNLHLHFSSRIRIDSLPRFELHDACLNSARGFYGSCRYGRISLCICMKSHSKCDSSRL